MVYFIEWAYTDRYEVNLEAGGDEPFGKNGNVSRDHTVREPSSKSEERESTLKPRDPEPEVEPGGSELPIELEPVFGIPVIEPELQCPPGTISPAIASEPHMDYRLLVHHAGVYIFAATYAITPLQDLVFSSLTEELTSLGKPSKSYKPAIIRHEEPDKSSSQSNPELSEIVSSIVQLFHLCFGGALPEDDPLLDWLGRYAAWAIQDFRSERLFSDVPLQMIPWLVKYLTPSARAPWEDKGSDKAGIDFIMNQIPKKPTRGKRSSRW